MKTLKKQLGFTLLEIMAAVVIIAIIAGFAMYSYHGYIRKSYRSEALNTLLATQLEEERYRSQNPTYGTLQQITGNATLTTPSGNYSITIPVSTATNYTITATANNPQNQDTEKGVSCSTLSIIVTGSQENKTPATCWGG